MKAFNRLSAGLCLSVFLFCPVHGVWGQGAGESSWQLKGLVDTYHAFRSEKPNDWMSSRTRLRGEVGKNFAGSSLFVSFNATYNALLKERTGFELREAYLDHRQEHWGFRLGRQLVIWGAADGVRITDLVSPMDMTEFLARLRRHPHARQCPAVLRLQRQDKARTACRSHFRRIQAAHRCRQSVERVA